MKAKLPLLMTIVVVVSPLAFLACTSRWERGGKCWSAPDKGGQPVQCPPPGTWAEVDGGESDDDAPDGGNV